VNIAEKPETPPAAPDPSDAVEAPPAKRQGLPIAILLSVGLGALMLIAVGSVLLFSLFESRQSLMTLLRDRWELTTDTIITRVESYLLPVEDQTKVVKRWIEEKPDRLKDERELVTALRISMAGVPQVTGIAFIGTDFNSIAVSRDKMEPLHADWSDRAEVIAAMEEARQGAPPQWGPPFYSAPIGRTVIAFRRPVFNGTTFLGIVSAGVTIDTLSDYLRELSDEYKVSPYILYGNDYVLAHPYLPFYRKDAGEGTPLSRLTADTDRVLSHMWTEEMRPLTAVADGHDFVGHWIQLPDDYYVFAYQTVTRFGPVPWIVGIYASGTEVGVEVRRFWKMAAIGGIILVVSVVGTALIGRRLAKPILEVAERASLVRDLRLDMAKPLPPSPIRELDEAARAFNAMLRALHWFETYIPRALVRRLIKAESDDPGLTRERLVTVMFTDMVGFSSLSERLPASGVADLLNEHFALLGRCIEAHEGTIDKFIGDSVMALWGAPLRQTDHAVRACRAALDIAKAVAKDNAERAERGLTPIGVRIGIHTGRVLAGNIGFTGRMNYTVVGDVVNVAQRIEQAGRSHQKLDGVAALASQRTVDALADAIPAERIGSMEVRGREEAVVVFRIV
jgi:adenylate cyclase